jgi:hypothetical protein
MIARNAVETPRDTALKLRDGAMLNGDAGTPTILSDG